jgi:hypothetical protein
MDDCCEFKYGITREWPAPLPPHPPYLRAAVYVILGISTQRLLVGLPPRKRRYPRYIHPRHNGGIVKKHRGRSVVQEG